MQGGWRCLAGRVCFTLRVVRQAECSAVCPWSWSTFLLLPGTGFIFLRQELPVGTFGPVVTLLSLEDWRGSWGIREARAGVVWEPFTGQQIGWRPGTT